MNDKFKRLAREARELFDSSRKEMAAKWIADLEAAK